LSDTGLSTLADAVQASTPWYRISSNRRHFSRSSRRCSTRLHDIDTNSNAAIARDAIDTSASARSSHLIAPAPEESAQRRRRREFDHEIANIYSDEATELLEAAQAALAYLPGMATQEQRTSRRLFSVNCIPSKAAPKGGHQRHGRFEPRTRDSWCARSMAARGRRRSCPLGHAGPASTNSRACCALVSNRQNSAEGRTGASAQIRNFGHPAWTPAVAATNRCRRTDLAAAPTVVCAYHPLRPNYCGSLSYRCAAGGPSAPWPRRRDRGATRSKYPSIRCPPTAPARLRRAGPDCRERGFGCEPRASSAPVLPGPRERPAGRVEMRASMRSARHHAHMPERLASSGLASISNSLDRLQPGGARATVTRRRISGGVSRSKPSAVLIASGRGTAAHRLRSARAGPICLPTAVRPRALRDPLG